MAQTFDISQQMRGDVAVVAIRGDVTPGKIEGVLSSRMVDLVDGGYRKLVLDLAVSRKEKLPDLPDLPVSPKRKTSSIAVAVGVVLHSQKPRPGGPATPGAP